MRIFIVIFSLLALCGCCGQKTSSDSWRSDDSRFSPREREVVSAARSYLEKRFQKSVDGYYTVKDTEDGYSVIVWFAIRYEHGRPVFGPSAHGIVVLHKDLSVADYLPGY